MSGHNKWSSIKHKKGAADAKRGKLFSSLSKEITLAAKDGGGDVSMNARLRTVVTAAKNVNMPVDNIERAIAKGTGDLAGGPLEELHYEGYGPEGVAILVTCLSDNRNRTAADVRNLFTKANGSLAGSGAVAWLFHRKSRFVVEGPDADEERLLELLLDSGADVEDVAVADDVAEILAPPEAFSEVAAVLEQSQIPIAETSLTMIPETTVQVERASAVRQILHLIEALEEHEDVQAVFANFDIADALMEKLAGE